MADSVKEENTGQYGDTTAQDTACCDRWRLYSCWSVGYSFGYLSFLQNADICVAPVLDLGRVLANRGHTLELATLEGQEEWAQDYISRIHTMGKGPSEEALDEQYLRMRDWDVREGFSDVMESKFMFDSYWTQTYKHLKDIMSDASRRPDMIIADFFVDAAKDMQIGTPYR